MIKKTKVNNLLTESKLTIATMETIHWLIWNHKNAFFEKSMTANNNQKRL